MKKYTRIFDDAKDVHVSGTVLFGTEPAVEGGVGELYVDAEAEKLVSKEVLKDLFFKGLWVVFDDVFYAPVALTLGEDSEAASVIVCAGDAHYTFKSAVPETNN